MEPVGEEERESVCSPVAWSVFLDRVGEAFSAMSIMLATSESSSSSDCRCCVRMNGCER